MMRVEAPGCVPVRSVLVRVNRNRIRISPHRDNVGFIGRRMTRVNWERSYDIPFRGPRKTATASSINGVGMNVLQLGRSITVFVIFLKLCIGLPYEMTSTQLIQ